MTDVKRINKMLKTKYGSTQDGRQFFRVVFSTNQTEKRSGIFNDFSGALFVRQFKGVREVNKYMGPMFKDFWILERLDFTRNDEIWTAEQGRYEPLWVFRTTDMKYLPLNWRVCDIVCYCSLYGVKKLKADYLTEQETEEAKEVELFENMMDNDSPWIPSQLKSGSAIVVPGEYVRI